MATRIRLLHDHGIRWGDWLDNVGAWLTAALFWLAVAGAVLLAVFAGLLLLMTWIWG